MKSFLTIIFLLTGFSNTIAAVEVIEFSNPENEKRYKALVAELRCLVCQNQNIAASNADLAKDLRQQVYQRIRNGETDQQIIGFMVQRYGDFVLYKPPLKAKTMLLWLGPFVLLVIGLSVMFFFIRSRSKRIDVEVDAGAMEHVRRLLKESDKSR